MPTSINWPGELNSIRLNIDGFSFEPGNNKIEASFQSGRSFSKIAPTQTPDRFSGYFDLDYYQLQIFENFWKTTLKHAVKSFNWHHPITDSSIEVKILGVPIYKAIGGNYYRVECNFEAVNAN